VEGITMAAIGLIYCGAVLFVNGIMLLGLANPKSVAILNLFVGTLQVVTPTVLILQAGADQAALLNASGIYLFGFTFLYVGIVNLFGLEGDGIGWYSAFVAVAALVYAGINAVTFDDPVFAVIWTAWAALWLLFFLLMALGIESLTRPTGWALLLLSQVTTTVPAFFILTGHYQPSNGLAAAAATAYVVLFGLAFVLGRRGVAAAAQHVDEAPEREPVAA
jgi:hypothetical protein